MKPRMYKRLGVWWVEISGARAGFVKFDDAIDYVYGYWRGVEERADFFLIGLGNGAHVQ